MLYRTLGILRNSEEPGISEGGNKDTLPVVRFPFAPNTSSREDALGRLGRTRMWSWI